MSTITTNEWQTRLALVAAIILTIGAARPASAQSGSQTPSLTYVPGSSVKLYQVNGDCDWVEWDATITAKSPTCKPTTSKTLTNADILGDDVPVVFENNGEMIVTFGDTIGAANFTPWTNVQNSFLWGAHDPIARSTTKNASDGLLLSFFLSGNHGLEVQPPPQSNGRAVGMGVDDVPNTGVSLNGAIYLGIKTGNVSSGGGNNDQSNDYSVLATFNEATETFTSGRTISTLPYGHFTSPTFYLAPTGVLGTPPPVPPEPVMLIFGLGKYRASNVYLSIIPSTEFASGVDQSGNSATRYFAGMSNGQPTWSSSESSAVPIVNDLDPANPTIGNVSVFYSQPLGLWLMMYDGGRGSFSTEGMYFTYAAKPWGPWSTPQLVFNACRDKGFGNFMYYYYATAAKNGCPSAMPAGVTSAPNSAGPAGPTIGDQTVNDPHTTIAGTYAPAFVERFTILSGNTLKLFYMFATWNPYAVVMMESDFAITPPPQINAGGVVIHTGSATAVSPGALVDIYGSGLAAAPASARAGSTLPTALGGVEVFVNEVAAPLIYVGPLQIVFQMPYEAALGTASVVVVSNGAVSAAAPVTVQQAAPEILVYGDSRAVVVNPDGSINASNNGAKAGAVLVLYLIGSGPLDNPIPTGAAAPLAPLSREELTTTVMVGGSTATVQFAGMAPTYEGLMQVNFVMPNLSSGDYPMQVTIGGFASNQPLVTVSK